MVVTMIYYNNTILHFLCDLVLCLYTGFDFTGYNWFRWRAHGHSKFTFPLHLFTHLDFPERPCCPIPGFVILVIMENRFRLTDDVRLFIKKMISLYEGYKYFLNPILGRVFAPPPPTLKKGHSCMLLL